MQTDENKRPPVRRSPRKALTARTESSKTNRESMANLQTRLILYRFYAQIGFSLLVVGLCIFQLTTKDDYEAAERAIYWSSLSGTVANWLPSPLEKVDKQPDCSSKRDDDDEDD